MKTYSDQNKSTSSRVNRNQPFFSNQEGSANLFIDIVNGKKEKITDLQTKANTDFQRMEELFEKFDDNSVLTNSQKNYLKNDIKMQTLKERGAFEDKSNTLEDDQAIEIDENVGPWSILCQVVFGPEKFYEFMMQVSDKSLESGQRRWYYTLIDLASLTDTSDTETQETESGQIEVED